MIIKLNVQKRYKTSPEIIIDGEWLETLDEDISSLVKHMFDHCLTKHQKVCGVCYTLRTKYIICNMLKMHNMNVHFLCDLTPTEFKKLNNSK